MAFLQRIIEITINPVVLKNSGGFVYGDPIVLKGYKMSCDIHFAGFVTQGQCILHIYNAKKDVIDLLTAIGPINSQNRFHKISISVGSVDASGNISNLVLAYQGQINEAWGIYLHAPTPVLTITSVCSWDAAVKPVEPTQTNVTGDLATVLKDIANNIGLDFKNINVNKTCYEIYETKDSLTKIRNLAISYGIQFSIENNTLIIFNNLGDRTEDGQEPVISKDTGLTEYPVFNSNGLYVQTMYNNKLYMGGKVKIESTIGHCSGIWLVANVVHNLECFNNDNGAWYSTLLCIPLTNS